MAEAPAPYTSDRTYTLDTCHFINGSVKICDAWGCLDISNFGKPLPWIGLYVAAASLVCTVCMVADLFRSLWRRKPWVASKFFPFNAATLTILAVATKIPSDITGAMPGTLDQFVKLSGVIFFCFAINHAMPSLGMMDGISIVSNMIALGILVISIFVNVRIQINTRLIGDRAYIILHELYSLVMMWLFVLLVSHSLTVTTVRRQLEKKYKSKHEEILGAMTTNDIRTRFSTEMLTKNIGKYWLMALTSSPDYATRSSGLSFVSAFTCWAAIGLSPSLLFVLVDLQHHKGCLIGSDYGWSVVAILAIQVTGITVGILVSILRSSKSKRSNFFSWRAFFKVEKYRIQKLIEWKDTPLPFNIRSSRARRVANRIKNLAVLLLILLQYFVVLVSKLILLVYVLIVCLLPFIFVRNYQSQLSFLYFAPILFVMMAPKMYSCCSTLIKSAETPAPGTSQDMCEFVLQLEGQVEEPHKIVQQWQKYPIRWIQDGRRNHPSHLHNLLTNFSSILDGFKGVHDICNDTVHFESFQEEPLNCWSLSLVNLASIVKTVFRGDEYEHRVQFIMKAVDEGLGYVRFVDNNLSSIDQLTMMQAAARMVWHEIDVYGKGNSKILDARDSHVGILNLKTAAEKKLRAYEKKSPIEWPEKVFAANSMYRITGAILQWPPEMNALLFEKLQGIIADIIGACLTNLPFAIFSHCSSGSFGTRENKVEEAAIALGETEIILKFFEERSNMDLYPADTKYVENWCRNSLNP